MHFIGIFFIFCIILLINDRISYSFVSIRISLLFNTLRRHAEVYYYNRRPLGYILCTLCTYPIDTNSISLGICTQHLLSVIIAIQLQIKPQIAMNLHARLTVDAEILHISLKMLRINKKKKSFSGWPKD
jgi:hypothetical protein